jgi:hypothetical protein
MVFRRTVKRIRTDAIDVRQKVSWLDRLMGGALTWNRNPEVGVVEQRVREL